MHFSTQRKDTSFTIDDDRFFLKPAVSAGKMMELMKLQDGLTSEDGGISGDPEKLKELVYELLIRVMQEKSVDLFMRRMYDDENPITFEVFNDVIDYVVGESLGKAGSDEHDS